MVLFSGVYMKMCDWKYVAYVYTCLCGMGIHECGSAYVCVSCVCVGAHACTPVSGTGQGCKKGQPNISALRSLSSLAMEQPQGGKVGGEVSDGGWEKTLGPAHKSNSPRQRSLSSERCRKSQ